MNRREVKRQARLRLHDDLLPERVKSIDREPKARTPPGALRRADAPPGFDEMLAATRRTAALAGWRARLYAVEISALHTTYRIKADSVTAPVFNPTTGHYDKSAGEDERATARADLEARIATFAEWTEAKIL